MEKKLSEKIEIVFRSPWWAFWKKKKKYTIQTNISISYENIVNGVVTYDLTFDLKQFNKQLKNIMEKIKSEEASKLNKM